MPWLWLHAVFQSDSQHQLCKHALGVQRHCTDSSMEVVRYNVKCNTDANFKKVAERQAAVVSSATSKYWIFTDRFYVIRNTRYQNYLTCFRETKKSRPTSEALTAPVLLSTLQSGMIFESVTIQLLILSLLLLSTAKKRKQSETTTTAGVAFTKHFNKHL